MHQCLLTLQVSFELYMFGSTPPGPRMQSQQIRDPQNKKKCGNFWWWLKCWRTAGPVDPMWQVDVYISYWKSWFFAIAIIYGIPPCFLNDLIHDPKISTMENIQNLRSWKHPPFFRGKIPGGKELMHLQLHYFTTWKKNADSMGDRKISRLVSKVVSTHLWNRHGGHLRPQNPVTCDHKHKKTGFGSLVTTKCGHLWPQSAVTYDHKTSHSLTGPTKPPRCTRSLVTTLRGHLRPKIWITWPH